MDASRHPGTALDPAIAARARAVRLLSCDVDGVLTDGRIYVDDEGRETKAFHALDGVGFRRLRAAGVDVAWITGSASASVAHRARALGIVHLLRGTEDKLPAWERLRAGLGIAAEACAHIGDDLPDVPLLAACGLAASVPDAPDEVKRHAHYVTRRAGGRGAARELAELILAARAAR
ncbi:3-deoxy-D-manno-octulosonate 8-phosphate phosphatase (KDO 8-P phosphatase) [Burkholderiales bacterium]|nr:3-deoxy-D-manno-octulosonate 8-phosphate phosphatase (KDO 8-P phosphatase) [Burkholderiales bacterium]